MGKIEEKTKDICEIKERLVDAVKEEVDGGLENVCTEEMGAVVDMIKDLAKAEKDCYEAAYYKAIVEAMEDAEEEEELMAKLGLSGGEGRMGYNTHHSSRTGRFISGRSGRMGYNPIIHQAPYMEDYLDNGRMDWDRAGEGRLGYPQGSGSMSEGRHGEAYNRYQNARRHYTETRSEADKDEMKRHAHEHVADTITTIRDIWSSADPELKSRMKQDFQNLINEMK